MFFFSLIDQLMCSKRFCFTIVQMTSVSNRPHATDVGSLKRDSNRPRSSFAATKYSASVFKRLRDGGESKATDVSAPTSITFSAFR